jgi:hypothetical protein
MDSQGWMRVLARLLVPCQEGTERTNRPGSDRKYVWSGTPSAAAALACIALHALASSLLRASWACLVWYAHVYPRDMHVHVRARACVA